MTSEAERFDTSHPDLCHGLRWKMQFIQAAPDPDVPSSNEGLFWCVYTQTCVGPDGSVAEPAKCSSKFRQCHGTGTCG